MRKITISAFISCFIAFSVDAQTEPTKFIPPYQYIASGEFDAMIESVPDTLDGNGRNQLLGNFNTFLGRADLNSALKGLPSAKACIADEAHEQIGSSWMLDHARDAKVLMFNENHLTLASRTFVRSHLQELREQGFTHIGFEALSSFLDEKDPEQIIGAGYYTIEPMFSALIREAAYLGFTIFGYESPSIEFSQGTFEEQRNAREKLQMQNIIKVIDSAPASSRFIIFAGWSHIAEVPLADSSSGGSFRWMASVFKEEAGIDPLTIDLTQCFYTSDASEEWQGRIFVADDGTPLVQGNYAGAVDAQIFLPVGSAQTPDYYRSALGTSFAIPEQLRSDVFPVLVQARLAGHGKSAPAYDRILLRPGEDFPLYLESGEYEITSYQGDGSIIGELVVHIE